MYDQRVYQRKQQIASNEATNNQFITLLERCGLLNKSHIQDKDIKAAIDAIKNAYRTKTFVDNDLQSSLFNCFDIVRPDVPYETFVKNYIHRFSTLKDCEIFFNDRVNMFCLYVFLRRCAILYRDTPHKKPYKLLCAFIKKDPDAIKKRIRAKPVQFSQLHWNVGLHEWLTCENTLNAIIRTGTRSTVPGVSHLQGIEGLELFATGYRFKFSWPEFNWIDFQFLIRTQTNSVIFNSTQSNLVEQTDHLSGHTGSVNRSAQPKTASIGSRAVGQPGFHDRINKHFNESSQLDEYIEKVAACFDQELLHHRIADIKASTELCYLSDGTQINQKSRVKEFARHHLSKPYHMTRRWWRELKIRACLNRADDNDRVTCQYYYDQLVIQQYHSSTPIGDPTTISSRWSLPSAHTSLKLPEHVRSEKIGADLSKSFEKMSLQYSEYSAAKILFLLRTYLKNIPNIYVAPQTYCPLRSGLLKKTILRNFYEEIQQAFNHRHLSTLIVINVSRGKIDALEDYKKSFIEQNNERSSFERHWIALIVRYEKNLPLIEIIDSERPEPWYYGDIKSYTFRSAPDNVMLTGNSHSIAEILQEKFKDTNIKLHIITTKQQQDSLSGPWVVDNLVERANKRPLRTHHEISVSQLRWKHDQLINSSQLTIALDLASLNL